MQSSSTDAAAAAGPAAGHPADPAAPVTDPVFDQLRREEFGRLDEAGHVYLDYTGSALYPRSLVKRHGDALCGQVLGNPHSRNPTSRAATELVDSVRRRVMEFFDADPDTHEVIFTPNATGALKLVGEAFEFGSGSRLVLTADNHNSAHGLREYARRRGAEVRYAPLGPDLRVPDLESSLTGADPTRPNLFVFPAQSNFSGVKHPLEWVRLAREMGYRVFLDAAAYVPTSRLSMREHDPDFACVSFYKMFGYPTGVGALIARKAALAELSRPWFSGGTVRFVSAQTDVELLYHTGRGFEDGTLNFLGICAVADGLDFLDGIGMERIGRHVASLTGAALARMTAVRHSNGAPVVDLYGPTGTADRGGTIAFNILDPTGRIWDFRVVDELAGAAGVSLRTGYFCNPGAAERALAHPNDEVRRCVGTFTADTFNIQEFSDCLDHRAVGAIRVSLGVPSNRRDVERLIALLESFRDERAPVPAREVGPGAAGAADG